MDPDVVIIDDDFTIDVEELDSDGDENYCIETEPHWGRDECTDFEFDENHVTIKEEIDFEENYIDTDQYVDLYQIKTELESDVEENDATRNEEFIEIKSEDSLASSEDVAPILVEPEVIEEAPNPPLPEKPEIIKDAPKPNTSIEEQSRESEKKAAQVPENTQNITPNKKQNKENTHPKPQSHKSKEIAPRSVKQTPSSPSKQPLDRRKPSFDTLNDRNRPENNDRRLALPKPRRGKWWKNRRQNRPNNNKISKFPPRDRSYRNQRRWDNDFKKRRLPICNNAPQGSALFNQTYSTILQVINEVLGQQTHRSNVQSHFQNNSQLQISQSDTPSLLRAQSLLNQQLQWNYPRRQQVWASDFRQNGPVTQGSSQLQIYTTILQAVTQLNNGGVITNSQNFVSLNNVKCQMSVSNVFQSIH